MKVKRVSAAVIRRGDEILATLRSHGEYRGYWEFPGGKLEEGETPRQAAVREVREELSADVALGELISQIEYDDPDFHLTMYCYFAEILSGDLTLNEHDEARWLKKEDLDSVRWLPADFDVIQRLKELL